jgi:hypothetical protein
MKGGAKIPTQSQKVRKPYKALYGIVALLALTVTLSSSVAQELRTWHESTVADFSDNLLENVVITKTTDGEIRLPHPMVKVSDDSIDYSVRRFVDYDSAGNYAISWIDGSNVLVQKRSTLGTPLTPVIQVNEPDNPTADYRRSRVALLDEGSFMVTWTTRQEISDQPMYGQVLDPQGKNVGSNIKFTNLPNVGNWEAVPVANNINHRFLVLIEIPDSDWSKSKIYVHSYDKLANRIGEPFRLNREDLSNHESVPEAQMTRDGELVVVWLSYTEPSSDRSDVYVRRYDHEVNPLGPAMKVNDTSRWISEYSPDISLDDQGRFLVVWGDERNGSAGGSRNDIYAELFDSSAVPIAENFRVDKYSETQEYLPDVDFVNGLFQVSWSSWNEARRLYLPYVNKWAYQPIIVGSMTSSVFDAGPSGCELIRIAWQSKMEPETSLRFKLRSAKSETTLPTAAWYGPSGTSDYYTVATGQSINPIHDSDRYIQYKAFLETTKPGVTPELQEVTISFAPSDTVPPSPPQNLSATSSHSQILLRWNPSPDADVSNYRIYRGTGSGEYDESWTKEVSSNTFTLTDSSAVTGTSYYYAVMAVDSSHNAGAFSNQVAVVPYGITLFVSPSGSAEGDGSITHPFSKIRDAIDHAIFGDVVQVLPGVYAETIELKEGVSLIGAGPNDTKIVGGGRRYIIKGANCLMVQGFTIARANAGIYEAITCDNASPTITMNVIINEGQVLDGGSGIGCYNGSSPVISKNYVLFWWAGIQCYTRSNATIVNNIIRGYGGIYSIDSSNPKIINNTIIVEQNFGGDFLRGSSPIVKNNIIYGNLPAELTFGLLFQEAGSPVVKYNDIWGVTNPYDGVVPGVGDIAADPLFTSLGKNDFRLRSGSPCIDMGDPDPSMNDMDNSRNDLGAFGGPDPIEPTILLSVPVELALSPASGFPGDTVSVDLSISNAAGLSEARFEIFFDNTLIEPIRTERTTLTNHFDLKVDSSINGRLIITMTASSELGEGPGMLLNLFFAIRDSAMEGESSPLRFGNISLLTGSGSPIKLKAITHGVILVNRGGEGPYVYVDVRSTGLEDGSRLHPYNTIQEGINHAASGDTVLVAAGIYTGSIVMKSSVFVLGMGAYATTLGWWDDSSEHDEPVVRFEGVENSGISGFTLANQSWESAIIIECSGSSCVITKCRIEAPAYGFGIHCREASKPVLSDNFILGGVGGWGAVDINRSSAVIQRNVILCTAESPGISSYRSSNMIISNNKFYVGRGENAGVQCDFSDSIMISNNLFLMKGADGVGICLTESNDITIVNNTLDTALRGILEINSTSVVMNNIIIGNSGYGISLSSASTLSYNDVWGNLIDYYGTTPGEGDITANPLFTDPSKELYTLQVRSPCRDAGNPAEEYNDLDGSRNDMGLYGGPGLDTTMFNPRGISLSIGSLDAEAGDTVCVPIQGKSLEKIANMEMAVSYTPEVLSLAGVKTTSSTNAFSLSATTLSGNVLTIGMSNSRGLSTNAADLAELLFVVSDSARQGAFIRFESAHLRSITTCEVPVAEMKVGQIRVIQTGVNDRLMPVMTYSLFQNYPNPFNPTTTIRYTIPKAERVTLKVYNLIGQEVVVLVDKIKQAGKYEIHWNAAGLSGGVYVYRLKAGEFVESKKLLLLK